MMACGLSEQLRRPIWLTVARIGLEGMDSSKVNRFRQQDSLAACRAEMVMRCEDEMPRVGHLEVRARGSLYFATICPKKPKGLGEA